MNYELMVVVWLSVSLWFVVFDCCHYLYYEICMNAVKLLMLC